jgi:hypothetical protein
MQIHRQIRRRDERRIAGAQRLGDWLRAARLECFVLLREARLVRTLAERNEKAELENENACDFCLHNAVDAFHDARSSGVWERVANFGADQKTRTNLAIWSPFTATLQANRNRRGMKRMKHAFAHIEEREVGSAFAQP